MKYTLKERFDAYFGRWQAFALALKFLLRSLKPGTPAPERGQDHAFASFYEEVGDNFAAHEAKTPVPSLVAASHGRILELGPAIGIQLPYFSSSKITHIYGIEPNSFFNSVLLAKTASVGLDDRYTIINCGIEDTTTLASHGIEPSSMDCVLSTQVLCSVADPAAAIKVIHDLLKPGGTLLFWEHQASVDPITRVVQRLWDFVWPHVIGGCHMSRPIKNLVLGGGNWEILELGTDGGELDVLPRVWGRLRKI